jgi:hypothetical protein
VDIYFPYVIVNKKPKLTRKDVFDWGVTCDPWKRFISRKTSHNYDDSVGMIILTRCSEENMPPPIRTPHSFGRVIEWQVGSFSDQFTPRDGAKSGDGQCEDPNNKKLAAMMTDLGEEVDEMLSQALENALYVTSKVSYYNKRY